MAAHQPNRTLSMILMVPDLETTMATKHSASSDQRAETNEMTSSMPVYHGSIVRIEQHEGNRQASDLIVRVPNFQHLSVPSIPLSNQTNTNSFTCPNSQWERKIKRRAPICPISSLNLQRAPDPLIADASTINTNRLASGLRSLSRAFAHGCKSKRATSISERIQPGSLPDVEVMREKFALPTSLNRHRHCASPIPTLATPKMLPIKRKHSKLREKVASSISVDTQTDMENDPTLVPTSQTAHYTDMDKASEDEGTDLTTFFQEFLNRKNDVIDFDRRTASIIGDAQHEELKRSASTQSNSEADQSFSTITQLVSHHPLSIPDAQSLSTHRYSTISAIVADIRTIIAENDPDDVSTRRTSSNPMATEVPQPPDQEPSVRRPTKSTRFDRPFHIQTSIFQPDISVIRMGTSDLTTDIHRRLPDEMHSSGHRPLPTQLHEERDDHQPSYGVIHVSEETWMESYEVTYQVDPNNGNLMLEHRREPMDQPMGFLSPFVDESFPPMRITLDPSQYRSLARTLTDGPSILPPNEYEQIENEATDIPSDPVYQSTNEQEARHESFELIPSIDNATRAKSRSFDDLSPDEHEHSLDPPSECRSLTSLSSLPSRHCVLRRSNSYDGFGIHVSTDLETRRQHSIRQVEQSSPGEQAGLKENDRILAVNGASVIDEDYVVVLQLIKHGLEHDRLDFDVVSSDTYNELQAQMDQLISENQQSRGDQSEVNTARDRQ